MTFPEHGNSQQSAIETWNKQKENFKYEAKQLHICVAMPVFYINPQ